MEYNTFLATLVLPDASTPIDRASLFSGLGTSAPIAGRDLRGCVVTADAVQTQRHWCRTLSARAGHYVLISNWTLAFFYGML